MPGQRGHHGLLDIGQPKDGDTVVVSAASGAVGSGLWWSNYQIKGCRDGILRWRQKSAII